MNTVLLDLWRYYMTLPVGRIEISMLYDTITVLELGIWMSMAGGVK